MKRKTLVCNLVALLFGASLLAGCATTGQLKQFDSDFWDQCKTEDPIAIRS